MGGVSGAEGKHNLSSDSPLLTHTYTHIFSKNGSNNGGEPFAMTLCKVIRAKNSR